MTLSLASTSSRWLTLARFVVLGLILFTVISEAVVLPQRYQSRLNLEPSSGSQAMFGGWTSSQIQQTAQAQGVRPQVLANFTFATSLLCLTAYWVMGGLLFWRKSHTWVGLLAAYLLVSIGPGFANLFIVASNSQTPDWLNQIMTPIVAVMWCTFFVMPYVFPNGKFVPRFTKYLAIVPYLMFILTGFAGSIDTLATGVVLGYALGGLASQIHRYRRVSTPEERQQTKWVVAAFGFFIGVLLLTVIVQALVPSIAPGTPTGFWWEFIGNGIVGILLPALLPLAIGAAILRYRLWDIDLLIRRTLAYTLLTALLGLVYFGGVSLLQSVFTTVSGQASPAALVISTLLIAALFNPLRRYIQDFIDRRFYRRKYDAEKALAQFAAVARSETDQSALTDRLVGLVDQTLQPANRGLWLRSLTAEINPSEALQTRQVKP